jgi:acyl-CoA reductase-like NAD-dependent aldehyde dehydrogenase
VAEVVVPARIRDSSAGKQKLSRAHRVAGDVEAGTVSVNRCHIHDAALLCGGVTQPGWTRQMRSEVIGSWTETTIVRVEIEKA